MQALVVHAHPVAESFSGALRQAAVEALLRAGHAVDVLDLHAEGFDPVMSSAERLAYHDPLRNRAAVAGHVDRLKAAQALVLVYPVWNFGMPAILKGWIDRVFLPGVSFSLVEGRVRPSLTNIRRLAVVTTYGGPRYRAMLMGDPPRRIAMRMLRGAMGWPKAHYLAHYDMNRSTDASRAAFLARVRARLGAL